MKKYYTLFVVIELLSILGIAAMYLNDIPFNGVAGTLLVLATVSGGALISMDGTKIGC